MAALLQFWASPSNADVLQGTFSPTPIPDGDPAGVVLDFASAPAMAGVEKVTLTMAHEWLGDLSVRLIPPSGPGFVLFQRLGVSPSTPEGSSAVLGIFTPTSSNVFALAPASYAFARTGVDLATEANKAVNTPSSLLPATQVYAGQLWEAGPFPAGNWQLLVSDSATLSTGIVSSAQIDYTPVGVPEPAAISLLAAATLATMVKTGLTRSGALAKGIRDE